MESLEQNIPGGYHLVHLEDRLNNSYYTVLHKLSSGGNATIWPAQDEHRSQ
jgi:hypothetical protein